jgi:hypothetical protein
MKNPGFTSKLIRFLSATSIAAAVTVSAQPDSGANKNHASRARPQVIYHLPPSSNYAATLHSQAKSQNSEVPNDISEQASHANPNSAAPQPAVGAPPPQERNLKPPQQHSSHKSSGRGNGHGNHPKKKK